jgi:hypothetical protein
VRPGRNERYDGTRQEYLPGSGNGVVGVQDAPNVVNQPSESSSGEVDTCTYGCVSPPSR